MSASARSDTQSAVIYARYSSHAQRDVSIEQQLRECRKFAERQGIEIVGIYEDRALTGTNDKRPGFQQMIRDAEKNNWSYIIVYTLDRFARDRYDSAVYKRQLKNCGVKVLSAMENISDDPTGILMESLLEGLAEYYSKELSRKIRRGMEDNADKCMANGSLPYGYRRGADGKYAIHAGEAAIVQEVFQRVKDGEAFADIERDLNARGVKTKTGHSWNKSSFNTMMKNERYTGVYIYGDTRIAGGIPQIISKELFDAVQYRLYTKNNPRSGGLPQKRRRENSVYLLTGKLFCGHCKSPMVGVSGKSQSTTPYYYYACQKRRKEHTCNKVPVRREYIELAITKALKEHMLNDAAIDTMADAVLAYQAQTAAPPEIDILENRLAEIRRSIKNLVAAVEKGIFSASTQNRLAELEEEEKLVSGQLALAQEETAYLATREELIAALKLFQEGDVDDKAYQEALIDTFLIAAYVYDDNLRIVFNLGSQKRSEVEIPFDIDTVSPSGTDGVLLSSPSVHHIGASFVSLAPTFFKSQSALTPLLLLFRFEAASLGFKSVLGVCRNRYL